MQVHPQSFAFTVPCEEYDELAGLLLHAVHAPGEVPEHAPRYSPTAQVAAHALQVYPLPSLWPHAPVRYSLAAQTWLSQLLQLLLPFL